MSLGRAFVVGAVVWAALLPVAAFAASRPAPAAAWYGFAFAVYGAGSVVCHQWPSRSFHLWASQLPVCARCTGIYVGGAIAAMVRVMGPTASNTGRRARLILVLALLPTAATLAFEWTTGQVPSNTVRALAGVPLGAAVAWMMAGVN